MLTAKLHRVRVTHSELHYEGSIAIDERLLELADMREYERVDIYNVSNGERFSTYTMRAEAGSGVISINGAAAHKAAPGDIIIVCTYAQLDEKEIAGLKPRLIYVDEHNRVTHTRNAIPVQAA
jgi:aspartate 1-decarboxylase